MSYVLQPSSIALTHSLTLFYFPPHFFRGRRKNSKKWYPGNKKWNYSAHINVNFTGAASSSSSFLSYAIRRHCFESSKADVIKWRLINFLAMLFAWAHQSLKRLLWLNSRSEVLKPDVKKNQQQQPRKQRKAVQSYKATLRRLLAF